MSNAIKFSNAGTIRVSVKPVPSQPGFLLFSVTDQGIGIAEDKLEIVFERFMQIDASLTRRVGGSGLGLSICRSLVKLMQGKIWVESQLHHGSTFYFTVYLPSTGSSGCGELSEFDRPLNTAVATPLSATRLRILIVDDSKENRLLVGLYLKDQPHDLIEAEHGLEALNLIKETQFDLILMDVHMPVMDGYTSTREIRQWEIKNQRPRTPILALTANAFEEDCNASIEAGCDEHVPKPLNKETLLQLIRKYSKNRH